MGKTNLKTNKQTKIQKKLQNKSKYKNNKCFSWVSAVCVLSFTGSHNLHCLTRMPSKTALVSGPVVGAAQTLIWSFSCVFLPPRSTAVRTSVFSFVGALNVLLYIPYIYICLPSWLCGFNLQLLQLVERFCIFFLSHTAPGFQLWFYLHLCTWVIHCCLLLRLPWRNAPVSTMGADGAVASGSTRYSGELAARATGNIVL